MATDTDSSESESLSGSKNPPRLPKRQFTKTFNTGEYTGSSTTTDPKRSSSTTGPVAAVVRTRPRRSRARTILLSMVFVGLFLIAVLSGIGVLVLINAETGSNNGPHGFLLFGNTTSSTTTKGWRRYTKPV
ncbi:hypothetical protein BIW11_05558 [Tropilaelaps mercedesae]|uniref:Uncharacterized protein n=1 Tax=Tropilaelaps mercedesae TaxID=418985 RepID=A0A1V9Y1Q5_9ACAR|nr:hypothetical protein BIW11_05558 [Tropilaelaps mercedesae]